VFRVHGIDAPTPVDLNEYQEGMSRDAVWKNSVLPTLVQFEANGMSCDFLQALHQGIRSGRQNSNCAAEGAADVFTLGLAELP